MTAVPSSGTSALGSAREPATPAVSSAAGAVSRRALLAAGVGLLAVGGCRRTEYVSARQLTARDVIEQRPFYIARHGGAGDWPEMTAYGYDQAARLPGLHVLDVAVCRSADGVLVCSFDRTTTRVTGRKLTILHEDWSTLSTLTVRATRTSDPGQPRRPLARLEEVLEAHLGPQVFVVEPRVDEAVDPLLALLQSTGHPEAVVWRQPVNSPRFAEAKKHGFTTYGYVLDEPAHLGSRLARYAASATIDLLGTSRDHSDAFVSRVARAAQQEGKVMVGWDVLTAGQRSRMLRLGCTGLAGSRIRELLALPAPAPESLPAGR